MAAASGQLPLAIGLKRRTRLSRFIAGSNAASVAALEASLAGQGEQLIYLWGRAGTGKSHLLLGAASRIAGQGGAPAYLPMREVAQMAPAMLEDLERMDLVCVDDIHRVAGMPEWQEGLFDLFNRLRAATVPLLVSADAPPPELPLALSDLRSRLAWGASFHLRPLDDGEKRKVLVNAARELGMTLSEQSADFLLRHYSRDLRRLSAFLDRLDTATLEAQRRPTLPFIKGLIADCGGPD
jgi:DnaA family protein